ncbi:type II toxin-antitoxin system VapC family toxin [Dyadobacter sp. MSC1_007]|uniref:type II toxin-antitoxin system VapC family toxin n=1 Tax=Dyadobacter sp. MSC1_007 TaxID=2909264 RepID=UPI00202FE459|nr:type II toxin-antitoxin system VapC family toxin [Dyadobacter sp. MSC1_007]
MKEYLIDTDIAIYFMKGKFDLQNRFDSLIPEQCYISEITLAELKFGVEKSERREQNLRVLRTFLTGVQILPIFHSLDLFAKEKARLQKTGTPLDDFDLLIGVTAVTHHLTMVTNNSKHLERIDEIVLENWVK